MTVIHNLVMTQKKSSRIMRLDFRTQLSINKYLFLQLLFLDVFFCLTLNQSTALDVYKQVCPHDVRRVGVCASCVCCYLHLRGCCLKGWWPAPLCSLQHCSGCHCLGFSLENKSESLQEEHQRDIIHTVHETKGSPVCLSL